MLHSNTILMLQQSIWKKLVTVATGYGFVFSIMHPKFLANVTSKKMCSMWYSLYEQVPIEIRYQNLKIIMALLENNHLLSKCNLIE